MKTSFDRWPPPLPLSDSLRKTFVITASAAVLTTTSSSTPSLTASLS